MVHEDGLKRPGCVSRMSDISKLSTERSSASTVAGPAREVLLRETDRCVMCGLCLPHCPTYGLSRNEADSPRGRIALVQGLLNGRLQADDVVAGHLDGCLVCRACENVCPSGVHYGRIIDGGRAVLHGRRQDWRRRLAVSLVDAVLRHGWLRRRLYGLMRWWSAKRWFGAGHGERLRGLFDAAPSARSWSERYRPDGAVRGRVGLFVGCTGDGFDAATLEAARSLLLGLGYEVLMPRGQVCCGALHRHAGEPGRADALSRANREAFAGQGLEAVVVCASACAGELREQWGAAAEDAVPPVVEVTRFVLQALERSPLDVVAGSAPSLRVLVHVPCSHRNVLKGGDDAAVLLSRLAGVELFRFEDGDRCCGAAGAQMLTSPAQADALVAGKIEQLRAMTPQVLVSSNVGCALHLHQAMVRAGLQIEVVHPVALFARRWPGVGVMEDS